jgi:hypothetical protein
MPDYWVNSVTNGDENVPGLLNLFDIGAKIVLKPFLLYAEIGPNLLYLQGGASGDMGVNVRFGAGLKFKHWGVNLSGTQVFANMNDVSEAFHNGFENGNWSGLTEGMIPTLNFVIYF